MTLPAYTRTLLQTALYWPPETPDGLGGHSYGDAVEISCRWQDVAVLFRGPSGEELTSTAVVYVDRVLEMKGYLALASFTDDVNYASTPDEIGAREIRQIGASPSLRAEFQLNKVYL